MFPFFGNCIGALDGTHIHATPPRDARLPFRNRKGFMSQNVLAVCTFDLQFSYVLAGWEGSASDARILQDALSAKGFSIPDRKMYVQRNCIERIFSVFKKRFRILESPPEYPFDTQVKLVYSLCAMHNVIMELENDPHFLEKVDEAKKKRDRKIQRRKDRRRGRRNNAPTRVVEDHTAEAGAVRDSIAAAMWHQYTNTLQSRQ
ncbi:hypothetical protein H257_12702 [Aphanomyces astaci]|uniref:DDE Tnp4 domain-containing protein n=1 Tax=Aphanomyces astaci TaxID=112090 RepID=W4FZN1_APHAT|nr:hypothetical protein H257_12702 [Aphanomyces astaci]ETV72234.1 hypothetical protein H257_12702 [Aphanomyces astaci]|eukprot:XP_009838302.1 hypothetical protein H257_12702 [Aphanomyces astaci]